MANTKLFKNTFFYAIGEVLPRAIAFILLPLYTRYLSPSDYGIISYTQTIIIFLYVLGAFSLNSYVLRYYFIHTKDEERKILVGTAQLTIISLNLIILFLALTFMPIIIERFRIQVPWTYFRLAFIINFLDGFSIIPLAVYRVRQEAIKFVSLGLTRMLLTVILTLIFVVYLKRGLIGTFQAQLYVLIPFSLVYLSVIQKYIQWRLNWGYLKEGIMFCAPLIPGAICSQLLSVSDRIILERYVGMDRLGIYNVACQMALVLNIVIQSGYKAIEPELFSRFGKDGFFEFVKKTQSIFFFIIYVAALTLCLFSQEVFYFMTSEQFHKGYLLVPLLIIGVIMSGQNVIYSGVLQGERRTTVVGLSTIVGAIISVSVNILFVPLWGTYAAAIVSAISFFFMNTVLFYAMTYPGKSMIRETCLVILVPSISLLLFFFFREICVIGICVKIIALVLYGYCAALVLRIDVRHINNFIHKKNLY